MTGACTACDGAGEVGYAPLFDQCTACQGTGNAPMDAMANAEERCHECGGPIIPGLDGWTAHWGGHEGVEIVAWTCSPGCTRIYHAHEADCSCQDGQ